jgi:hypothetical protein
MITTQDIVDTIDKWRYRYQDINTPAAIEMWAHYYYLIMKLTFDEIINDLEE